MGKKTNSALDLDVNAAIDRLMHFLSIEGTTGQEAAIGQAVQQSLLQLGVPSRDIRVDDAHQRIPLPTQTGNLIVKLPGTKSGPVRLFMTHLDTVPLCAGARPVRKGNRIVAAGETALGGDNRTGVACLVTLVATLLKNGLPHPPLTLLFTVREESGLWGARHVDVDALGSPEDGYNIDGGSPEEITIGAVGADRWQAEITGRAAHAGVYPERGVSATMVASLALADVFAAGWFGKIKRRGKEGTSNIGVFGGKDGKSAGVATNVVTDHVHLFGESRSHDLKFVGEITDAYRRAFRLAAQTVRDHKRRGAKVRFDARRDYYPFRLKENLPVVRHAADAAKSIGLKPRLRISNGGLDANWLVRHGIPTITFGAGQNNIHAIGEYVDLANFERGCRMALALAMA
jgi:tripeptide aminopeptidase